MDMAQLQSEFAELCSRIAPSLAQFRFPTERSDDGFAHVEITEEHLHYVVTERGQEHSRQTTTDKDELLYWLVSSVVAARAGAYEFRHRVRGQSFRRLMFAKTIDYMARVRTDWAERTAREIDAILAKNPFDDIAEG
jgi:hypothetical protein